MIACEQQQPVQEAPSRTVKTITVEAVDDSRTRSFTGVSKSAQEAKLSFKVSGTLTALNVAVGDNLAKNQTIATLDATTFQLQLQQSQADLARTQAEERNANAAYQRVKGLYENQSASRNELDTARASAESAKAQVSAVARAVELARLNQSYTVLKAKEACSVASTSADVGENVNAGQEIVRVNCGETLNIDVSVPESLIAAFKPGMKGNIRFNALPDQRFQGEVNEVGIAASGTAFAVTVNIASTEGLRSGMAAQVDFEFDNLQTLPVVPTASVSEDEQGRFVYLLMPGESADHGLVKRQTVEIGELTAKGIEIVDGIQPGDKLITAGISVIRDGLVVKDTPLLK